MCFVDAACRILRITIFVFQKYFNKSRLNFILTAHITKHTLLETNLLQYDIYMLVQFIFSLWNEHHKNFKKKKKKIIEPR